MHAMSARSTTLSEEQARRTLNTSTLHSHTHTPLEHKTHSVWVLAAQSEARSADGQTVHEHGGEAGNERREGGVPIPSLQGQSCPPSLSSVSQRFKPFDIPTVFSEAT